MGFTLDLKKESFKFSGSHFTIFSAQKAERLHGHNYYVSCRVKVTRLDPDLGMAFDFNLVKPIVKSLCEEMDEFVLIPARSKFLKIQEVDGKVTIQFAAKTYILPAEDVRILPLVNITSEELARHLTDQLIDRLAAQFPAALPIESIAMTVTETQGQSVTFEKNVRG